MLDKWESLINFPGTLLFEESVIRINIYHVSRLAAFGIQQDSNRRLCKKKSGTSKEKKIEPKNRLPSNVRSVQIVYSYYIFFV